jgi:hypothetical protein
MAGEMSPSAARIHLAQALPVILLLCVALNQLRLVFTQELSPWSGGGFGMFSTTDAATDRHLHAYESTPALRRELALPAEFEDDIRRALALPSERQLRSLAELLREELGVPSTSGLEILVWSNQYAAASLTPHSRLLRHYRAGDAAIP